MALPFLHRRCEQEKFVRILITLCHDGKEKEFFFFWYNVCVCTEYILKFCSVCEQKKKLTTACGSN